jgi:hypothetical protein
MQLRCDMLMYANPLALCHMCVLLRECPCLVPTRWIGTVNCSRLAFLQLDALGRTTIYCLIPSLRVMVTPLLPLKDGQGMRVEAGRQRLLSLS